MDTASRLAKNDSYYARFAAEVGARTEARDFSKALGLFLAAVHPSKTILDIGSGTGVHLQQFKDQGFKALGVEPSLAMRELCAVRGLKCIEGSFEGLLNLSHSDVGGIWCASSLLHVPKENLRETFQSICHLLPAEAPFYFTVRLGEGCKWDQYDGDKSGAERFIQLFEEKELNFELSLLPLRNLVVWTEESTWGRPSQWISVVGLKRLSIPSAV